MSETQKPLDAAAQVGLLAAKQAKEKIAELERRHNDLLALVERVAELHPAASNAVTTQRIRDDARRILGRSE